MNKITLLLSVLSEHNHEKTTANFTVHTLTNTSAKCNNCQKHFGVK